MDTKNMISFENSKSSCKDKEGEKKRSCCKEAKCELVGFHSLPAYLKDNKFILGYYRCEWPLKQTILSIFSIHNETLNIWTHLIGFFIFLALTLGTAKMVPLYMASSAYQHTIQPSSTLGSPNGSSLGYTMALPSAAEEMLQSMSAWDLPRVLAECSPVKFSLANQTEKIVQSRVRDDDDNSVARLPLPAPAPRWPFYAFLCGAMLCLLMSSTCHLLSCHSEKCSYAMLRLDYTGISTLIVTSTYPIVYYTFMCDPFFRNLYMGFITSFGFVTILFSLVPAFQTLELRKVRVMLFICLAISGWAPMVHKMMAFGDRPEAVMSTMYEILMFVLYGAGVVIYATRVPERWMPGRFDLVGHSHQLFHVLVIAGAYAMYNSGLVYLEWRDVEGC